MVKKMQRRRARHWGIFFPSLIAAIVSSCGIFTPRGSEPPDLSVTQDPIQFSSILAGTVYQFNTPNYEDIFHPDAHYENINTTTYSKSQLIQRLKQVQRQLSDQNAQVTWSGGEIIQRDNTIYINGIVYAAPNDTGTSNFIVIRDEKWRIFRWLDSPNKPGESLFTP